MGLNFGDLLSNALHDIKKQKRKKIQIIQDEIGYTFEPHLTGDAVESWRYRKGPPTVEMLETLASAVIGYGCETHDQEWLMDFLEKGKHPYPQALVDRLFPDQEPIEEAPQSKIPVPLPTLSVYAPPAVPNFVGRSEELNRFKNDLDQNGLALICGMAGVGKTTLASHLAQSIKPTDSVFWHSFHPDGVVSFIHRLAGFLAGHGRAQLWEMIESARQAALPSPEPAVLLDILLAQLRDIKLTLCLDDLQFVDDSPEIQRLIQHVLQLDGIRLLITSRHFPSFWAGRMDPLGGFGYEDAQLLIASHGVTLDEQAFDQLVQATAGNGAFLMLASVALRQADDPAELIQELAQSEQIERFLLERIHDRLPAELQELMIGISILGGYPGTQDALEAVLDSGNIRRSLQALGNEYLIVSREEEHGRVYRQHQIVQEFYYDQPSKRTRKQYHLNAADFYFREELDSFKAVYHATHGGDAARATELFSKKVSNIINQGMARPTANLLPQLESQSLEPVAQLEFWLAQAQLLTLLGENGESQTVLQKAAEMLQNLPADPESDRLKGEVCLKMGQALERQSPPDAMRWVQRGTEMTMNSAPEVWSELRILEGTLNIHSGNYGAAMESLHDGLETIPNDGYALRAHALHNLAGVNMGIGKFDEVKNYGLQALEIATSIDDYLRVSRIYINLGVSYFVLGERQKAVSIFNEGIVLAHSLGSKDIVLSLQANLGACLLEMGKYQEAEACLAQAAEMAEEQNSNQRIPILSRLSEAALQQGKLETVLNNVAQIETVARAINDQSAFSNIYRLRALVNLEQDQLDEALKNAQKAIDQDKMLGDQWDLGRNYRILGEIYAALDEFEAASKRYAQSIELLSEQDAFQSGITMMSLGKMLYSIGELEKGEGLIRDAFGIFSEQPDSPEYKEAKSWLINKFGKV